MRFLSSAAIAALLSLILPALSVGQGSPDWSRYAHSDIDELVVSDSKDDSGSGIKIWPVGRRIRLDVTLDAFPEKCDTRPLKVFLGATGINMENLPPITTCVKFKSRKGRVFSAYIQDQVGEFIPKEAKIGQPISLYTAYFYMTVATQTPGLLINEFDVPPQLSKSVARRAKPN